MQEIVKEGICSCGCKQTEHSNTQFEAGHGNCKLCGCPKFTWVSWAEDTSAPIQKINGVDDNGEN